MASSMSGGAEGPQLPIDHKVVEFYHDQIQEQVKDALESSGNLLWTSFTLTHTKGVPTIRVTAKETDHPDWEKLVKNLQNAVKSAPEAISVEVVQAELELLTTQSVPFKPFALGDSTGIQGVPKGSGTIGGYLALTSPTGGARIYGLTNNHVVNVSPTTQKQSPDPTQVYNTNTIIVPSKEDLDETATTNPDTPKDSFKLGTLKFASGRQVTSAAPFHLLDWALVAVSDGVYDAERLANKKVYKVNYQPGLTTRVPTITGPVINVGQIQGGMRVWKYGRTTAITEGLVSQTLVQLEIPSLDIWKDLDVTNLGHATTTSEYVVYLPNGGSDFCRAGDSGSWVLDAQGLLVGLLWGQINGYCLVTDIHVIFASILSVPQLAGYQIGVLLN